MAVKFRETIDEYLKSKNEKSRGTYAPRLNSFYGYLHTEKNINDQNFQEYLAALKTDVLVDALNYYIVTNDIHKQSAAYFYARAIKDYFHFLNDIGIENFTLLKEFAYKNLKSYDAKMKEVIENNKSLKKVEGKEPIDIEDIKLLITELDERIEKAAKNSQIIECVQTKCNPYNDLTYFLALKIIAFSGIDYNGIRDLRKDCFDVEKNKIVINSYNLHLPDNLASQLKYYVRIKNERKIESEYFFVLHSGEELVLQTREVSDTLNEILQRKDLTGLRKYVIIEMILKGINQSYIMKLTGAGTKIFDACQRIVNEHRHFEANRFIDSRIREMEIFDIL